MIFKNSLAFSKWADYFELTKPRLISLVILTTAVGFYLASKGEFNRWLFGATLMGTSFVSAGAMALNEWIEWRLDAKMARTASRPIPAGRLRPIEGLIFGILILTAGLFILWLGTTPLATFLAAVTALIYLLAYTPLKTRTTLNTIVGAVPGALPPMIGWTAASGPPNLQAWSLFGIIFLWQMPHFLAIAWFCRDQYASAGFKMLSGDDPKGLRIGKQMVFYTAALVPVSLLPTLLQLTNGLYFFTALFLGGIFLVITLMSLGRLSEKVSQLFRWSIIYLALLFIAMVVDKI